MKVNIYLTQEQRKQLTDLMYKYRLSRSTIADIILYEFTHWLRMEGKSETIKKLGNEYLYYENKGGKTCIKPQRYAVLKTFYENLTKAFTNALVIYFIKDFNKYVDDTKGLLNSINTKFQKTKDENWDYDRFIRSMSRYERKKEK